MSQSWKTKIDKVRSTYPAVDTILQVIDDVKFRGRKSKDDTIDADYLSAVERGDMETEAPVSKATKNRLSSLEASVEDSIPQPSPKNNTPDGIDADYLSAVERGDMETAQRMVDEATIFVLLSSFFHVKI
ncbi:MAG: hypothetical protein UH734_08315 [Ruminococcus sp.]|nr:hypothetical protein [Ruminococcus sp.]